MAHPIRAGGEDPVETDEALDPLLSERERERQGRERVANERERIADQRDSIANGRELEADEREQTLDEWERALLQRASVFGIDDRSLIALIEDAAKRRTEARSQRVEQRRLREEATLAREMALSTHEQAERRRRLLDLDPRLALVVAGIANDLDLAPTLEEVLERVVETALTSVEGCDAASIAFLHQDNLHTEATTAPLAEEADHLQVTVGEGPSRDALAEPEVYASSFPDSRWPKLGEQLRRLAVRSVVSYRLATSRARRRGMPIGTLNLYAQREQAFSNAARQVGLILATHASIIVGAAQLGGALDVDRRPLREETRLIAQATGILSARMHIGSDEAIDALAGAAKKYGSTILDVAKQLIDTGSLPEDALDP